MASPAGPIQVQPAGLLGLLQLKSWGERPNILQGSVLPNLDMEPWWLRGSLEPLVISAAPVNLGPMPAGFTLIGLSTLPTNEWWFVHWLNVFLQGTTAAAEVLEASIGVVFQSNALGAIPDFTVARTQMLPTGTAPVAGSLTARGFWVPPGSQLCLGINVEGTDVSAFLSGLAVSRAPI